MTFLIGLILAVGMLYLLVPKGYLVYEGLRFPKWSYRMKRYPSNGLQPKKHEYGNHKRQYLIHYHPNPIKEERTEVVVYIHGGGWQFGNPEMFRPNANILDEKNYHSFFLSHRRVPTYNVLDMKQDIVQGMKRVKELMDEMGLLDEKIILGGVSSGANLAALFYFDDSLRQEAGLTKDHFAGLMLLAAPLNIGNMWPSPTVRFLAGSRSGEMFLAASPINYIDGSEDLPILIVHPEKDGMVPLKGTLSFVDKAKQLGFSQLEFHVLPEMTHMDAASWCFKEHICHDIVMEWLERISQ